MSAPFHYVRVTDNADAVLDTATPETALIAGGTTLVDLMRLGVMSPTRLIDINRLPLASIETTAAGIAVGALARNSDTAYHPLVRKHLPGLSEALLSGASPQLRNMATTGGNIMQRTRCAYFRDVAVPACNKRHPGSGCAAMDGHARQHAILGGSQACIAVHPSDLCVALVALEALVHVRGRYPDGVTARVIPMADFHLLPGTTPERETSLAAGELITHVTIKPTPLTARSVYVKARDRASYAFALASAAAALHIEGGKIRAARVALGGVATKPWRSAEAEQALVGQAATRAAFEEAAAIALRDSQSRPDNQFKVPLATATIIRALERSRDLAMSTSPYINRGIDRVDAQLKVTGQAVYSAEVNIAGLVHAVVLGSTTAKATIDAIDVAEAQAAPGVLAVVTHKNAGRLPGAAPKGKRELPERILQILQDDRILYDDQPVAVVVANTLDRARHAATLVKVTYQGIAQPTVTFDQKSTSYAPERANRDSTDSNRGDVAEARARASSVIDATYTTPVENHNPMEMHATIAVWHGTDALTLYDSTQGIFGVRKKLAQVFGLQPKNVRVLSLYVGGGFGCKGTPWSHVVLAALAARAVGRPVKLMLTRQQMFSLVGHRPRTIQRVRLAAAADGQLAAVEHDVISHTSTFDEFVEPSAVTARHLYTCANVRTSHRLVRLDIPTPTFTRAPGESSGSFALECAMDELSYALGVDPVALRLKNHADRDLEKDKPYSSKSLRACYQQGAEAFGWAKRPRAVATLRDGRARLGWGMATATYPAGQSPASAWASVRADGTALVRAGSQDIGTGTYTIMSQIAADALGLPVAKVRFELGDTLFPETPVSGGSRTASSVGPAVKQAGYEVRKQVIAQAIADPGSPLHGKAAEDIEVAEGILSSKSEPSKRDPIVDVLARANRSEIAARAETKESEARKGYSLHSFGAQFVEVRVDEELGLVRVQRMVGAFAAGTILNTKTARSQFMGGMVWGVGMALHEHTVRDRRSGRVVTRDLADYHVPVNADIPAMDIIMVAEDDPIVNNVGAKGIGEIGITGVAAAIANAVYHATGRRVRDLPITVDKLVGVTR